MGQQDIYNFLKEHRPNRFKAGQVSKSTGLSIGSVENALRKLRRRNDGMMYKFIDKGSYSYWIYWIEGDE